LRLQARRFARRAGFRPAAPPLPWWIEAPDELEQLERALPAEYTHFERTVIGRSIVYRGEISLDPLPVLRRLALVFPARPSKIAPVVMADGPRTRRHRFTSYRPMPLCMWYARDEPDMQWQLHQGLIGLIDIARVHLVREARFRQTRRWRGLEVHADGPDIPVNRAFRRMSRRDGVRLRCWCGSNRRYTRCHGEITAERELLILGIHESPASAAQHRYAA